MPGAVIAITPGDGRDLRPWIAALGDAGLPALLLREPHLDAAALAGLVATARTRIPTVLVHARNPHALTVGADGVHLASADQGTPPVPHGRSCHSQEGVDAALATGATWVFWSPVWRPTSKPSDTRAPLGPEAFLAGAAHRPVYALGGVTPARHRALRAGGAHGSAVLGDLFGRRHPSTAAARLRDYLTP